MRNRKLMHDSAMAVGRGTRFRRSWCALGSWMCLMACGGGGASQSNEASETIICDHRVNPVLAEALREELGLTGRETLIPEDLERVRSLVVTGLATLDGCQCLTNLERLTVTSSAVTDLSPLADLSKLSSLTVSISTSEPPDLTTLTAGSAELARSLRGLTLIQDRIADLRGLGELTALTTLNLRNNEVRDLSPLNGLSNLQEVNLQNNRASDVTPLASLRALENLTLNSNEVATLRPLSGLASLSLLYVANNSLTAVGPLDLPNLWAFRALGNSIASLGDLSGMSTLRTLDLQANQLTDLAGMEALPELRELNVGGNALSGVEVVANLPQLEVLSLYDTQVEDLSPLQGLVQLQELILSHTPVTDLSPLLALPDRSSGCRNLTVGESVLDAASQAEVLPRLCAGSWQIQGEYGYLCEKVECNPL